MSDAEKLVDEGLKYPAEPLILRPPVGNEVVSGFRVSTKSFLKRNRSSKTIILLSLLIALLLLFIFYFIWQFTRLQLGHFESTCKVFLSDQNMEMEEKISYEPSVITLSHENIQHFPPVRIFHLLADALSILRTPNQCYVYSMRPEVQAAIPTDELTIERIKESANPKLKLKMSLSPQIWMLSHEGDAKDHIKINHPAAAANCSDRPIFHLRQIIMSQVGQPPMFTPQFSPDQSIDPPVMLLPPGEVDPFVCPDDCPLGESRDTVGGQPRRVCRCPFKEMNDIWNTGGLSPLDDDEDDDRENEEDGEPRSDIGNEISQSLMDTGFFQKLNLLDPPLYGIKNKVKDIGRHRRSAPVSFGSTSVKIPRGCRLVDTFLEGGLPNQESHILPEMMIVKC